MRLETYELLELQVRLQPLIDRKDFTLHWAEKLYDFGSEATSFNSYLQDPADISRVFVEFRPLL